MMRRFFRRTVAVLLLLAGIGCLGYWWIMRRSFPDHARYIPAEATFVVTLNIREIGFDFLRDEPSGKNSKSNSAGDTTFLKAIRERNGGGISLLSDVIVFGCAATDSTPDYNAAVLKLRDENDFSDMLRTVVQKKNPGHFSTHAGLNCWQNDSLNLFLAWNREAAIAVKSLHSDSLRIRKVIKQLFSLTEQQSICSNADFVLHESESFDVGFWADVKRFTESPPSIAWTFLPQTATPAAFVHGNIRFAAGGIGVVMRYNYTGKTKPPVLPVPPSLRIKPDNCYVYWQTNLAPAKNFRGDFIGAWLQEESGKAQEIRSCLSGYYSLTLHDSVHYRQRFMKYTYDDNFNMVPVNDSVDLFFPGLTAVVQVKDTLALKNILTAWAVRDSLPVTAKGMQLRSDYPFYIRVEKNVMLVTSLPEKIIPQPNQKTISEKFGTGIEAFVNAPALSKNIARDSLTFPGLQRGLDVIGSGLKTITWSEPIWRKEVMLTETTIMFSNAERNGLVQLLELFQF